MKVAIVADTNAGISQEDAKKLGVSIVPMPVLIDGEEYFEDISITQPEFYEKLLADADVSTSQPNIYSIVELWKELLKTHDEIVHIPMSSALSASMETATNFAKEFNGKVQVVDNKRISVTLKQSVLDAVKLAKDGKSAKEIKEILEATGPNSSIYILVNTLKYLKKGGRITPAAAAIGSLLKIKPVLAIQGGKLDKFKQVISYAQGKKIMIEQIAKEIETRFAEEHKAGKLKIFIAYTHDVNRALEFEKEINEAFSKYNLSVSFVDALSLSISCHIGDGAIAIACSTSL